jgi:ABC-type phosphate transport system substrate-binding protein
LILAVLTPGLSLAQQAQQPSTGGELGRSIAAPVLSVVYAPLKLCVGIAGALLGGISGWATGGDERAAQGIWQPTIGGSKFITPAMLEGTEPFQPFGEGTSVQPATGTGSSGSMYP